MRLIASSTQPAAVFAAADRQQVTRILIAEDDADLRLLLRLVLHRAGYRVSEARDGVEALEAMSREAFDVVLLDNMDVDQLRQAVTIRNARGPHIRLEASGGVTLATLRAIAETGVDFISVGRITQSAPAVDIGLDYTLA